MTDLGEWGVVDVPDDDVDADGENPQLYYPTVDAFVDEQLAPTYRRELEGPGRTWCPEWWRHAEAIARLEALWRAWEHLRLDPATGISVWFRDHADHHMAVLLDPDGPFKGCSPDRGHSTRLEPLPTVLAPEGIFGDDPVAAPFGDDPDEDPFGDDPIEDPFDVDPDEDPFDDEAGPPALETVPDAESPAA